MHQQAGKTKGVTIPPAKLLNLALVTAALGLCSYTPGETSKISDGDGAFMSFPHQQIPPSRALQRQGNDVRLVQYCKSV